MRLTAEQVLQDNNRFANCNAIAELKYCGWEIPQRRAITNDEIRFYAWLCRSAVAMLKEQEARVMALDELTEIYVEFKGNNCPVRLTNFDLQKIVKHAVDGDCRLWTGKPTDEQRQAVKWDD